MDPEPPGRRELELLSKQRFPRSHRGSLNINTVHCQVQRGCVCSFWVSTVPLTANQRANQALSSLPGSTFHLDLITTSTIHSTASPEPGFLQETVAPESPSLL